MSDHHRSALPERLSQGAAIWTADEYLTVSELAERVKLKPKTVRNRMHDGTWRKDVHWFRPPGIGPRFRWLAIVRWFEQGGTEPVASHGAAYGDDIPLPRRGRRRT